jgi:WD40 repeat protein/class 3 adenylate cyclase
LKEVSRVLVFFFTDIEGSTRLWEEHTAEMGAVIARHDAILQQQIAESGGRITKHTGDGVTAAFDGGEPVTCALETQVQFAREDWGAIGELRIRVGLHAGEGELHAGDYFGPAVNCTARVMSAGWGGQILLTPEVTSASELPAEATLRDLGQHLLKDVSAPQQLYQLLHPELSVQEFPPLRTLSSNAIQKTVAEQGQQLVSVSPAAMAVGLASATLVPTLLGDLSPSSPALVANLGVLGDLGAGTLRGFLRGFVERLRARQQDGQAATGLEIRELLESELLAMWEGGGEAAAALRADASRLLQAVQGVDAALEAATAEVKDALARGLADLGGRFDEFGWMLSGLQDTLAEMRARQAMQFALQREQLDLQREQLVKTNLLLRFQQERAAVVMPVVIPVEGEGYEDLPPADVPCPYKGLAAFEADDAEYFFGREELVAQLTARLAGTRFLAVVGPSGSGKSSLVKAGLLPAIWQDALPGSKEWHTLVLTPGAHPLEELAVRVSLQRGIAPSSLLQALQSDAQALDLAVKQALLDQPEHVRLLLVVDQFEEVFALCRDEDERRQFIDALLCAVEAADSRTVVVLTIRADFYGHCADYPNLAARLQDNVLVGPLGEEELRQVIERPAGLVGLRLEPGLAETIVGDVAGEPGALPLLSHALLETWERRRGYTLTLAGYAESGGVAGAIAQTADTVFEALTPEQHAIARSIFLRLTELGEEGTQDTRRRVAPAELIPRPEDAPTVEAVLKTLADARLITTGEETVEVAHEAMIREWPALRAWLDEDREGLRTHRHLTETAQEWERLDREPGELYRGARLATASEWEEQHADLLNPLEREFLAASQRLAWSEERERQRRRQQIMVGMAAALAITLILALMAVQQWQRAGRGEQEALRGAAIGLTAQALAELEGPSPERGVLLALEALEHYPYTAQAEAVLAQAVRGSILDLVVPSPWTEAPAAVWSPDGQRVAAVDAVGTNVIWDANTGQELLRFPTWGTDSATSLAWSPSGGQIATAFAEPAVVRTWVAANGEQLHELAGHEGEVLGAAWSPDGSLIISCSADGTARVWDAQAGVERLVLAGHAGVVQHAAWSPAGDRILTASEDGTARLWDAETGAEVLAVSGPRGGLLGAAWSPDGQQFATAGEDGTVRMWDAHTGTEVLALAGHHEEVRDVAWSPDGKWIATASADGTARAWNAGTGTLLSTLYGLTRDVQTVAWSPQGGRLATSGGEFVRLWDMRLDLQLVGHEGHVVDASRSPDGTRIVTAGVDGTARVWNAYSGEMLLVFSQHEGQVRSASWSPAGDRIVTSGSDGTARVWDPVSGEELTVFAEHSDEVWHAAWSADGRYVVTTGADRSARIWDSTTGEPMSLLNIYHDRGRSHWSPDGQRIVTAAGYGGTHRSPVFVWDAASGKNLFSFVNHGAWMSGADWSPDGTRVVSTGYDGTARIWDPDTGEEMLVFAVRDTAWDAAWSPNGQRLVTGDQSGAVKVWDAATGVEVYGYSAEAAVLNVDWSPDGQYVIASGPFEVPLVRRAWQSTEDLIAHARECCVSRELTPAERERFGLPQR